MTTNYLNATHGLASWLLTKDHKRSAILYLVSPAGRYITGQTLTLDGGFLIS